MLLTSLLVVGLCLAQAVPQVNPKLTFNFREFCYMKHLRSRSFAICDGNKDDRLTHMDLHLDGRTTASLSEIDLSSFKSVTFHSTVQVGKIIVRNTKQVSLVMGKSSLKDLKIDTVDDLLLEHQSQEELTTGEMESLSLTNVNKIRLVSGGKFPWPIKSVKLNKVGDVEFGSSQLVISAINFTIVESNIRLNGRSALTLNAVSASIDKSVLYLDKNGCFNVTVDHFSVGNTKIDVENGTIHLINSKEVTFANSSFYGFDDNPLSIVGHTDEIKFVQNDIFASDVVNMLRLSSTSVVFVDNSFGCNNCTIKEKLLATDLGDVGDVNYCYTNCNLTINRFKTLLNKEVFCNKGESDMTDYSKLCTASYSRETSTDSGIQILQWILFVTTPLLLIISLLFCICQKDNMKKLKAMVLVNVLPQDLECERVEQQGIVCNDGYDNAGDLYEPVVPCVSCK